jgi:hypothetical protein
MDGAGRDAKGTAPGTRTGTAVLLVYAPLDHRWIKDNQLAREIGMPYISQP